MTIVVIHIHYNKGNGYKENKNGRGKILSRSRIPVTDLDNSVRWYADVLRFVLRRKTDERAVFEVGEGPLFSQGGHGFKRTFLREWITRIFSCFYLSRYFREYIVEHGWLADSSRARNKGIATVLLRHILKLVEVPADFSLRQVFISTPAPPGSAYFSIYFSTGTRGTSVNDVFGWMMSWLIS